MCIAYATRWVSHKNTWFSHTTWFRVGHSSEMMVVEGQDAKHCSTASTVRLIYYQVQIWKQVQIMLILLQITATWQSVTRDSHVTLTEPKNAHKYNGSSPMSFGPVKAEISPRHLLLSIIKQLEIGYEIDSIPYTYSNLLKIDQIW